MEKSGARYWNTKVAKEVRTNSSHLLSCRSGPWHTSLYFTFVATLPVKSQSQDSVLARPHGTGIFHHFFPLILQGLHSATDFLPYHPHWNKQDMIFDVLGHFFKAIKTWEKGWNKQYSEVALHHIARIVDYFPHYMKIQVPR